MQRYQLLLIAALLPAGCQTANKSGNGTSGSELASVNLSAPTGALVLGSDYDEIKVMQRQKNSDGTYTAWSVVNDFPNLIATSNLNSTMTLKPGTYRFNEFLLKAGTNVAYGSETDANCLLQDATLVAGNNPALAIKICRAGTTGPAPDNTQPGSATNPAANVNISSAVVNGSGTTATPVVTPNGNSGTAAAITAVGGGTPTGTGGYPICQSGLYVQSATSGWGWSTNANFCHGTAVTQQQFQTSQGCSCVMQH